MEVKWKIEKSNGSLEVGRKSNESYMEAGGSSWN